MRKLLLILLVVGGVSGQNYGQNCDSIGYLLEKLGIEYGTSYPWVDGRYYNRPKILDFYNKSFKNATLSFSWANINTGFGVYNFTNTDVFFDSAQAQGKKVHIAALFFPNEPHVPVFARTVTNPDTARRIMTMYIDTLLKRYKGKINSIGVFNEFCAMDTTYWFACIPDYIKYGYTTAKKSDPSVLLMYNESLDMHDNIHVDRRAKYVQFVKKCVNDNVPVDLWGIQCHMSPNNTPHWRRYFPMLVDSIRAVSSKPIWVTELDWRIPVTDTAYWKQWQAKEFTDFFTTCIGLRIPNITVWDWIDERSWINGRYPGYGYPCMFDTVGPKPAYYAVVNTLKNSKVITTVRSVVDATYIIGDKK